MAVPYVGHPWPITSKSDPISVGPISRAVISAMTPVWACRIADAYSRRITVIIGRDRVPIVIAVIIVRSAVSIAVIGRR